MHFGSQLRLPLLFPLLLATLSSAAVHRRAVKNDFSDYPSGTQQCLDNASDDSRCSGNTVPQMNQCLCSNGGNFVTNAARCIAEQDPDDMESTWGALELHCSDSNTPISISKKAWMAEQSSVSTTTSAKTASKTATKSIMTTTSAGHTTTATITTTPTATSSPVPEENDTGLSGGTRIAVIAGSAVGGAAVLAAAVFIFCRYRRRRNGAAYEEVHAMGVQSPYGRTSKAPAPFGSPDLGGHASYQSTTVSDLGSAPDPRRSWHPSPDGQSVPWSPGAFEAVKQNPGLGNLHQPPPDIHEMSTDGERPVSMSPSAPVEMPTISVTSPTVSPASRYSRADWDSQLSQTPQEPRRYEPYRPAR
ncbi:hypothetical protein F5883DRAFT_542427 [Diaporthe sp. PMI_573]|nr:hypothetical protein F5883DRAFT_542427 [Diaporthaceae sp. PMI_573]